MKQWFLLLLIALVPVVILAALFYSFGKFLYAAFDDWRELRQLDAIKVEQLAIRERRGQESLARLDNGCDHVFGEGLGFPPDVCPKCGLAKDKPPGGCDHLWRRVEGPIPTSSCEKCGKQYRADV